jgi:lysyl-tRNA synthetase class 1
MTMSAPNGPHAHWAEQLAEQIQQRWSDSSPDDPIICASGISPSGPIHMGNLREVFTTHLVVDVLKRWGLPAVHLHSWDDYDRLRKLPAGVPAQFERYVGMPLASAPDPAGARPSYAEHFIDEFTSGLDQLGIEITPVRQSERYPAGTYNAAIRRAMDVRELIFDTLAQQQTAGRQSGSIDERRRAYYPFKPYCESCGYDATEVLGYADGSVRYHCHHCGYEGEMSLADGSRISGKLVWKVDWPMRWKHEGVIFEPAGEDHHAPTGSFTVGRTLVREVFGGEAPLSTVYSFVTLSGVPGKMSGSVGTGVTPKAALEVLEPVIIRWPYVQRQPSQSFGIDLSPRGIQRLYDHWDQFAASAAEPDARPEQTVTYRLSTQTVAGELRRTARPVAFRLLASVADLTNANREQMARIVATHLDEPVPPPEVLLEELEPRLSCAIHYATEIVPADQRTVVRTSFDEQAWSELDEQSRAGIELLAQEMAEEWSLDGLTKLVYGVPKVLLGLPPDAQPTPELKRAQREFFKAIYRLLCGAETGPRLPTLMLSIGPEQTARLLGSRVGASRDQRLGVGSQPD